jgi:hypothetical protein
MRADPPTLNPQNKASLEALVDDLVARALAVDPTEAANVRADAMAFLDEWEDRQDLEYYWHFAKHGASLLASLEDVATAKATDGHWRYRARGTPNSMRNVEAATSLRLTERLTIRDGDSQ